MSPSPDSATRGPYPFRTESYQMGRYITLSCISCWMRWRMTSRFLGSSSPVPAVDASIRVAALPKTPLML